MKKAAAHALFLIAYCLIIWLFNRSMEFTRPGDYPEGLEYARAVVAGVVEEDMGYDADYDYIRIGKQTLELTVTSGPYKGKTVTALNYVTRTVRMEGRPGTKYIIGSYDGFLTPMLLHYDRTGLICGLAVSFLALVLFFGKKKGIAAVAALMITLVNVVFLFMPMLINGVPAILAAVLVVLLSTLYTMTVLNGFCRKSLIAASCCTVCTALAGLLAWLAGLWGGISSLNTPEAEELLFITENTGFRIDNLLTAGILIAAMGAVMDTSMSIVSSLYEMKQQNPGMSRRQLLRSGMNIGRDIMGTMTNTLILAFAGSSLNLLVIYYMYSMPAISVMNTDFMVVEVMKGLIGSLAVVMSIPAAAVMTAAGMEKM